MVLDFQRRGLRACRDRRKVSNSAKKRHLLLEATGLRNYHAPKEHAIVGLHSNPHQAVMLKLRILLGDSGDIQRRAEQARAVPVGGKAVVDWSTGRDCGACSLHAWLVR